MHAVHRRTIDCGVRSKIPGMSAMVPAAAVILSTRSSVSIEVSYTCLDFLLCGHKKQLVYETGVETEEDLVARIIVAAGTIADMPGIFERTRQSVVRRCTACIQANGRAFEQFL